MPGVDAAEPLDHEPKANGDDPRDQRHERHLDAQLTPRLVERLGKGSSATWQRTGRRGQELTLPGDEAVSEPLEGDDEKVLVVASK